MASGATSGAVSGAASGAVMGTQILPGWGTAIGAVVGGISGFISGSSSDSQQATSSAWANYNNQMQYNTNMYNIESSLGLAKFNAAATMMAANAQAAASQAAAEYNAGMIFATTSYNALLEEQELSRVWEDAELDLLQLEQQRARERGGIIGQQAASGTVIGEGSNADVIISQQTQEYMDSVIIQHGAERQAANIQNQIVQGMWQGQVAISQTRWEGQMAGYTAKANAAVQAGSTLATANVQANADRWSANTAFNAGANNIAIDNSKYGQQQTQNMVTGLFNAAAMGATMYGASKVPQAANKYASKSATSATNYKYMGNNSRTATLPMNSIRSPGTSLAGAS